MCVRDSIPIVVVVCMVQVSMLLLHFKTLLLALHVGYFSMLLLHFRTTERCKYFYSVPHFEECSPGVCVNYESIFWELQGTFPFWTVGSLKFWASKQWTTCCICVLEWWSLMLLSFLGLLAAFDHTSGLSWWSQTQGSIKSQDIEAKLMRLLIGMNREIYSNFNPMHEKMIHPNLSNNIRATQVQSRVIVAQINCK